MTKLRLRLTLDIEKEQKSIMCTRTFVMQCTLGSMQLNVNNLSGESDVVLSAVEYNKADRTLTYSSLSLFLVFVSVVYMIVLDFDWGGGGAVFVLDDGILNQFWQVQL